VKSERWHGLEVLQTSLKTSEEIWLIAAPRSVPTTVKAVYRAMRPSAELVADKPVSGEVEGIRQPPSCEWLVEVPLDRHSAPQQPHVQRGPDNLGRGAHSC
jgi:hypothetical protein